MRRSITFWSFLLFSAVLLSSTRSQTDDADQLQEANEEARKKIEELTKLRNLAEVKVLVLNKELEANKQQSSIVQNDLTAAELKIAQLTRQLAAANEGPRCNQNETNQLKDVSVQKLALLDEVRTKYSDLQNCPINIGTNSTCKKIRGMGCYCIVEVEKSYSDAADYCARNNMTLVGIETREEWDLLRGFLTDNLGSREKYDGAFWTSGVDENSDGRWQWTSSKQPLLFRNWGGYYHSERRNRLVIDWDKPFVWFNGAIKGEKGLYKDYFICESSALLQEVKHLTTFVNSKDCPHSIGTNSTCVYLDPDGCYCVVFNVSNWIEGSRHCKNEGMELVSIETEAEHWQIAAFLREHQPSYWLSFWTSALNNEEKSQWVWTATGQSVNYTNWADGQPQFDEGEEHSITLRPSTHKMFVEITSLNKTYYIAAGHYICERNTNSVDGPRNSQMKQKSCSAGSDWTCRNEVTGCYCHQTIKRNWADASSACKSIGMNFVSIESAQEQLLVASGLPKLNDTTWWWTSGSDASGVWTWTATGRAMNYTNWAVDEPTKVDNSAHAVGMRFWNDIWPFWFVYPLKKEYFPLCEK